MLWQNIRVHCRAVIVHSGALHPLPSPFFHTIAMLAFRTKTNSWYLKWNSQPSKVEGLDPGFFQDFHVEGLDPGFLYAINKHQAKIPRFFIGHIFNYVFCPVSIIRSRVWIFVRMNPTFWLAQCYPPGAFAIGPLLSLEIRQSPHLFPQAAYA